MAITLDSIVLPGDMEWLDEFAWSAVSQQIETTFPGSLIIEESAVQAGRPITLEGRLEGDVGFAVVDRETVQALQDLADAPLDSPLTLTLEDGRTFDVRFRYGDGTPVAAKAWRHIVPQLDGDWYQITLRLMQV